MEILNQNWDVHHEFSDKTTRISAKIRLKITIFSIFEPEKVHFYGKMGHKLIIYLLLTFFLRKSL